MLLHSSESKEVPVNVKGTLEAAHEAISAFFLLVEVFGAEARVWWVFCHRAFLESVCMGNVLREQKSHVENGDSGMFARARGDISKPLFLARYIKRMILTEPLYSKNDRHNDQYVGRRKRMRGSQNSRLCPE